MESQSQKMNTRKNLGDTPHKGRRGTKEQPLHEPSEDLHLEASHLLAIGGLNSAPQPLLLLFPKFRLFLLQWEQNKGTDVMKRMNDTPIPLHSFPIE